ncbi:Transcriptional regulator, TetR family [[Actinomadura] parvosata subsp. kistnae]|uniref:TetR family transcriptional regulator n=1 Tax=[Actinomadura] parvosata subsp. kistnae TaxID=1909395 RepID=A0A1V0A6B9_9ACTN|nr:TetR/AcrR family transcriptional regulator [Nonomuraea sp. ATCC 55076]AQZ65741.1 TetR family transcriptional regulator [Nonomuraea sp. ATCC 55076]SPL97144.1 Transcriptional regulator, TetR family [Actinomadura parvosata subsp. kistnae]
MGNESTRLSAQDWARAALKAIAHGGLAAVAVEPLARTLGVTKGSFYAHYRNRDELITAALTEWVRSHGEAGLSQYAAITDPAQRLRELLTTVVHAVQPLAPSVHLSLLGDRNDPRAQDAVRQVNQARLDLLTRTYRELGLPPDRAASRARVAYAAILGLLHLAQTDPAAPHSAVLADEATAIFLPS